MVQVSRLGKNNNQESHKGRNSRERRLTKSIVELLFCQRAEYSGGGWLMKICAFLGISEGEIKRKESH